MEGKSHMREFSILQGDVRERMAELPAESVQCVVTSPPYWGLRDYKLEPQVWGDGWKGSLGLEPTPELFIEHMVSVFREVRRVLRKDGTCWLNLGDSYYASPKGSDRGWDKSGLTSPKDGRERTCQEAQRASMSRNRTFPGLKPKDLCGIPWRVALALQADGWWLRSDIVWYKPNPMPESVRDRPTRSHEYVFLLTKSARYFFDQEAVREPSITGDPRKPYCPGQVDARGDGHARGGGKIRPSVLRGGFGGKTEAMAEEGRNAFRAIVDRRNIRSVWTIATAPFPSAHFATFPPVLVEPCVKAGTSERGCCPECGAQWERVVEKANVPDAVYTETRNPGDELVGRAVRRGGSGQAYQNWKAENPDKTLGWQPTCDHGAEPSPCTVLDPFAGAGTALLVALRLGRDAIGIELNPEYCEMARQRILADAPLLNREVA